MKGKWIAPITLAVCLGAPVAFLTPSAHAAMPGWAASGAQDRDWDRAPDEYNDVQRRGFHDGIEGARKDFENHRPPSPENRDEYRHPHVPRDMRHVYREAFRHGYEVGMHHMMGDHHDRPY